jgi:hypothetical protein
MMFLEEMDYFSIILKNKVLRFILVCLFCLAIITGIVMLVQSIIN